ncbi:MULTISPECIES: response regulator [Bacillaceae]|jgi:two-component system CitB family response regulator|uniref:response regulator n=2 Tax=Bacillaceae TaxID=186817 RepID=UPI000BF9B87B|nr:MULTISPECIES: response regulator [Bacillaceae]MBT2666534.1 response regulator [Bacillus sp. ISL-4]MBT2670908.1 response regulator [Streptomyces sp. ISL-14]MCT4479458.1 response regulator [Peribacillus frigoritolerans]MCY8935884.1 response regulator [Peribacillus frigoritolerans]MCZ0870938.1 response regulator [Peribacillus sp. AS_2]
MMANRDIEVLIVEDDLRIAEIQKLFIEKLEGFQTIGIASSYDEAKSFIEIMQPDLLLLDMYFPDMNGLDILKEIKQQSKQMDVIMITAAKEIEKVQEAIKIGIFDYIIKPVAFERFKQSLLRYQEYHIKLSELEKGNFPVTQQQVDKLLRKDMKEKEREQASLPKGIDRMTLEKVMVVLGKSSPGLTAEIVAKEIGVSRTTARRYLEHLMSEEKIDADLTYGTVGRPERVYAIKL